MSYSIYKEILELFVSGVMATSLPCLKEIHLGYTPSLLLFPRRLSIVNHQKSILS